MNKKAFTLIELLIAIAIFIVIIIAVYMLGANIFSYNTSIRNSFNSADEARRVIRPIIDEIRTSRRSVDGAFPIFLTATSAMGFFTDVNKDSYADKVIYRLYGNTLKKTVSFNGPVVSESIFETIHNVRNTANEPIFEYYGTDSILLTQPVSALGVKLVKLNLYIDADPNRPPDRMHVTTQVQIRNLRDDN